MESLCAKPKKYECREWRIRGKGKVARDQERLIIIPFRIYIVLSTDFKQIKALTNKPSLFFRCFCFIFFFILNSSEFRSVHFPGRVSEKKMLKIRYASNQWPQSPQDKMREATTQNEQSSREESEITRYSSEIIFCFFLLSSSSYVSHFVAVCKTAN